MQVLTINCGSSTIKFKLFDMHGERVRVSGMVERIGEGEGTFSCRRDTGARRDEAGSFADHRAAVRHIVAELAGSDAPEAVGHRIVHGGEAFDAPAVVDARVLERIRAQVPLAPLHNPAGLLGIEVAGEAWPGVPQVAVFDTAFHQSMPPPAYRYAVPNSLYAEYGVRRYGFHGTSHQFVAERAAEYLGRPLEALNLITLHLGQGASATAIRGGVSAETSMGMTPLEGLMMGTRCGDLDPAIPEYLVRVTGRSAAEVDHLLNHESGLKGICGAHDMREVRRLIEGGDSQARLAFDMFCHRIRKYIGAYTALLGRVDALVFTGGIGEHDPHTRAAACTGLEEAFGFVLDPEANQAASGRLAAIHTKRSRAGILVVATDEELAIARQTVALLDGR